MTTFLASAVLAALISSIANLIIGYKALNETRKFTKENRNIEFLKTQRKELLNFSDELSSFKSKSNVNDFIEFSKNKTQDKMKEIMINSSIIDFPKLKKIYSKYSNFLDKNIKEKIDNELNELDKKVSVFVEFIAKSTTSEENVDSSKIDYAFLMNSGSDLEKLLKEYLEKNIIINNEKYIKYL